MPPKDYVPPKFCIELSDGTYQEIDNIHNVTVEQIEAVCERYELLRVTRCKDCKYYAIAQLKKDYTPDERFKPSVCVKGEFAKHRSPEWYCADGEPKEET